jgi:acyl-lipid omega-6 desaturase (Delta-12 desaturase)
VQLSTNRPAPARAGTAAPTIGAGPALAPITEAQDWKRAVEPYIGADSRRAVAQVIVAFGLLALGFAGIYAAMSWSIWLALALVFPTAGLLVRSFILMHDCAHGSLFESRRANDIVGYIGGVLTLTPFDQWRRDHALHHASSGDLDRRGHGDVPTLTVAEYKARTPAAQRKYRFIRHPATLMLLGPIHLMIGQRIRTRSKATKDKQISAVWKTNFGIAAAAALAIWAIGWQAFLVVYLLPIYFAAMGGIWLFYVQHQFEDAYWAEHGEWDYVTASLQGSSHLKLSPVMQWFTGSIGLHHIHHLAPRIPNYRLQECHDAHPVFQSAPVVTWRSGFSALRLALWDEESHRMVRFSDLT